MKLVEIDGKSAPGAKVTRGKKSGFCEEKKEEEKVERPKSSIVAAAVATRENKAEGQKPNFLNEKKEEKYEKDERPKVESQAVTKQRFGSPKLSLAAAAKSYRPSGIRKDNLRNMDTLFSKTTLKGKSEPAKIQPPPSFTKKSAVAADPASTNDNGRIQNDFSGLNKLSRNFDIPSTMTARDPTLGGANDPMHEVRLLTVRYEQEMCRARLEVAQAKIAKAEAEEKVLRATKACAQKEAEALSSLLEAYANAESKLQAS
jgi:hypothetical protein